MTEVGFYILASDEPEQRALFACRLAEKAFHLGHRVYMHTTDLAATTELDDLLWRFRSTSFVPHAALVDDSQAPVVLGHGDAAVPADVELLINLALAVPDFFSQFARVSEIVVQTPAIQQATRAHYRYYRDHGCPLQTHHLRG